MASSSSHNCPCAACKFLRRKCKPGCVFAPYFPPEEPQKFSNVHKIFGASNVTKLLNELPPHQREDAVNTLAFEAEARVRDPVYGCIGAITFLHKQIDRLQKELDAANADLIRFGCNDVVLPSTAVDDPRPLAAAAALDLGRIGEVFYQTPYMQSSPYLIPWEDDDNLNPNGGGLDGSF